MRAGDVRLAERFGLHGKTAVVTGASTGIGAAVAELFVDAGARVVAAATTPARIDAVVGDLRTRADRPGDVIGVPTDISREDDVVRLYERTVETFGRVDVLVNCVGLYPVIPFLELTVEQWDHIHAVNTRGAFLCIREAVKHMRASGEGGSIVAVSSLASIATTIHGHAQYGSSKAGVNMLVKTVALEFAKDRIRANAVLPGAIDTEGLRTASAGYIANHVPLTGSSADPHRFPMGRLGLASEVAAACLFLASPAASYVTGQLVAVAGGLDLG